MSWGFTDLDTNHEVINLSLIKAYLASVLEPFHLHPFLIIKGKIHQDFKHSCVGRWYPQTHFLKDSPVRSQFQNIVGILLSEYGLNWDII